MGEFQLAAGARVDLGTIMIVDAGPDLPRLKTKLIGVAPGEFLLLQPVGWSTDRQHGAAVAPGRSLAVRYLHGGRVFGFRCTALGVSPAPRSVIFFAYPERIEEHNLRKSDRVACLLPATLAHGGTSREVLVVDLSLEGCLCLVRGAGEAKDLAVVELALSLALLLPGVDGAFDVACRVKNLAATGDEMRLGLAFESPPEPLLAALRAFIASIA